MRSDRESTPNLTDRGEESEREAVADSSPTAAANVQFDVIYKNVD